MLVFRFRLVFVLMLCGISGRADTLKNPAWPGFGIWIKCLQVVHAKWVKDYILVSSCTHPWAFSLKRSPETPSFSCHVSLFFFPLYTRVMKTWSKARSSELRPVDGYKLSPHGITSGSLGTRSLSHCVGFGNFWGLKTINGQTTRACFKCGLYKEEWKGKRETEQKKEGKKWDFVVGTKE